MAPMSEQNQLNVFLFFKTWFVFSHSERTLRCFEGEAKNKKNWQTVHTTKHNFWRPTAWMFSWLVFKCFCYSSFRRSCWWCIFFDLSLKYLLNEGTTSNPVELCCFLWHIALEGPCSPATQIVVTPGAWWFEDLSGRRMAQKTTRGFAPISRVLYVFVLILFE